jgi:uncharacterized protein YcgL (UPF0745 family)
MDGEKMSFSNHCMMKFPAGSDTGMNEKIYQNDNKRLIEIFRSTRDADCYLYVDKKEGLARVPQTLLERFGKPVTAMTMILEPNRKLARADASNVLDNIRDQGFYLQMPPLPDSDMFAIRASNNKLGK